MAFGSLYEVISELYIALDKGYINQELFDKLYNQSEEVGKMLSSFRATMETSWIKRQKEKNAVGL